MRGEDVNGPAVGGDAVSDLLRQPASGVHAKPVRQSSLAASVMKRKFATMPQIRSATTAATPWHCCAAMGWSAAPNLSKPHPRISIGDCCLGPEPLETRRRLIVAGTLIGKPDHSGSPVFTHPQQQIGVIRNRKAVAGFSHGRKSVVGKTERRPKSRSDGRNWRGLHYKSNS